MKTLFDQSEKFEVLSEIEMNQVKGGFKTAKEKDIYEPDEQ